MRFARLRGTVIEQIVDTDQATADAEDLVLVENANPFPGIGWSNETGSWQPPVLDPVIANAQSLTDKATQALATNVAYLAIANPSNAQIAAQVKALTRQTTAVIRLLTQQLDSTSGS